MRKLMIVVFIALFAVWGCSPAAPKTEDQKAFYALGAHLNKQLSVFDLSPEELKYVQQTCPAEHISTPRGSGQKRTVVY